MQEQEIWRDIAGYEGLYQVSDLGRVRSLDRIVEGRGGSNWLRKGRILRPRKNTYGYLMVTLSKEGKHKNFTVHRLVAKAFVTNTYNNKEINHINEEKTDNRASNLEWCTRKENINFGTRTERAAKANINNPKYSKPVDQLDLSGNYIQTFPSIREAARQLNKKSAGPIGCVLTGRAKTAYGYRWRYAVQDGDSPYA